MLNNCKDKGRKGLHFSQQKKHMVSCLDGLLRYEFFNGLFSFFGVVVERKEKKRSHHVVKIQSLT